MASWQDAPVVDDGGMAAWAKAPPVKRSAADYATEGMSGLDKILANLGAGMDTAYQGAKGLWNDVGGVEGIGRGIVGLPQQPSQPSDVAAQDAAVRAKRQADKELADRTTGGGALQIAGEILPTLAIPGGVAARGIGMAGRGLASAAVDSSIVGGLVGAAQPVTSDEFRTLNAAIGSAGGAALPGLIAAAKYGAGYLTKAGAQSRAAGDIIRQLGGPDRAAEVLTQIDQHLSNVSDAPGALKRDPISQIPLTPAEISQNTTLGRMERTSQAQNPEKWTDLRSTQATTRYDALQGATSGAGEMDARVAARDAAASPLRSQALSDASTVPAFEAPVERTVADTLAKFPPSSPSYKLAQLVGKDLADVGSLTPDKLYETRKLLASKLSGPLIPGDETAAIVKGADRTAKEMIGAIDDALDSASGGKWKSYLETYSEASRPVDSSRASQDIRGLYEREGAPQLAGVPQVTGANLGRAIDRFGSNKYGPTLDDETRAGLQALQDNLGRTEGLQKLLRMTGTSGGGSNTAMDLAGMARGTAAQLAPVLGTIARLPIVKAFVESADATTKAVLADFLQNPQTFTAAVSKKLGSGKPLTRAEDAVLRLARSASAGLPALALGQ